MKNDPMKGIMKPEMPAEPEKPAMPAMAPKKKKKPISSMDELKAKIAAKSPKEY